MKYERVTRSGAAFGRRAEKYQSHDSDGRSDNEQHDDDDDADDDDDDAVLICFKK